MQPGRILPIAVVMMSVACVVPAHAETVRVVIKGLGFEPARISARVGDTVEWVNEDILAHTATVRGDWDVLIPPKKTVGFVLKKPGDVEYFCRFHPNMTARIAIAPN
jgi:plastocyanin